MDTATGQVFNLKTYQEDVLKINSYYDKIGFGGQMPSHVTDVNIDTAGVLTLTIQEGLTVRHIIIVPPPDADPVLPRDLITAGARDQRRQLVFRSAARQRRRQAARISTRSTI